MNQIVKNDTAVKVPRDEAPNLGQLLESPRGTTPSFVQWMWKM
jgi:hypothetical protein